MTKEELIEFINEHFDSISGAFYNGRMKIALLELADKIGSGSGGQVTPESVIAAITSSADGSIAQAKISGLVSDLSGKAPSTHNHTASQITDFQTAVSANNDLSAIRTLIGSMSPDGDNLVNTLAEIFTVFQDFQEGVSLSQQLAGKVDKDGSKVLSDNNYTTIEKNALASAALAPGGLLNAYDGGNLTGVKQSAVVNLHASKIALELLALSKSALNNNPQVNDVMSSPPSVSSWVPNSPASGLGQTIRAASAGAIFTSVPFIYTGGAPKIAFDDYLQFMTIPSGGSGNVGGGQTGVDFRIRFMTDAPKMSLGLLNGSAYRFIVDGKYVSRSFNTANGGGGLNYITLDFTTSVTREITIEGFGGSAFHSVAISENYKLWRPAYTNVRLISVGDSFMEGAGAGNASSSMCRIMSDFLGVYDVWNNAIGGSGYNSGVKFIDRLAGWGARNPDIVLFCAGHNDPNDTTLRTNALAVFQATRTALPNAIIIVTGVFPGATGPSAAIAVKEIYIKEAFDLFADPLSFYIPISSDTEPFWVSGTGRVGTTNGGGNSDIVTSSDSVHPSPYGHYYLGQRLANGIVRKLSTLI